MRGSYAFAVGHRMGEYYLKTWTLEEDGSGWNPSLTIYQLGDSEWMNLCVLQFPPCRMVIRIQ